MKKTLFDDSERDSWASFDLSASVACRVPLSSAEDCDGLDSLSWKKVGKKGSQLHDGSTVEKLDGDSRS